MRTFSLIAFATISMWMVGEVNAQQLGQNDVQSQQQADGEQRAQRQRGQKKGRRGRMQQGERGGQGQGRKGGQGGAQMLEFIFNRFDKDQNGKLSQEEAPERMKQRFDTLDTNGDKTVSREEMEAAFAKMQGKGKGEKGQGKKGQGKKSQGKDKSKNGAGQGGADKGKRGGQTIDPAQLMQRMDKNNDGLLSADEAPERLKKNFDRIDADSNGSISIDEMKAMFEKLKSGKGGNKQIGRNKSADENATKPVKPKRPPMADDGA